MKRDFFKEFAETLQRLGHIPQGDVIRYMQEGDLATASGLSAFLLDSSMTSRIRPALSAETALDYLIRFYLRCMSTEGESDDIPSPYVAGHELANLLKRAWMDSTVSKEFKARIKNHFASFYVNGDAKIRNVFVNGFLEHLFELREIQSFFEDWKDREHLLVAFNQACEWTK